jgi:hypothetical protein
MFGIACTRGQHIEKLASMIIMDHAAAGAIIPEWARGGTRLWKETEAQEYLRKALL